MCIRAKDGIPLEIYTTDKIWKDICNSYHSKDELIQRAQEYCKCNINTQLIISDIIEKTPINVKKLCKKRDLCKNERYTLKKVKGNDNGWDMGIYDDTEETEHIDEENYKDPNYEPESEMLLSKYNSLTKSQKDKYENLMNVYNSLSKNICNEWIELTKLLETCSPLARAGGYSLFTLKKGQVKYLNEEEPGLLAMKKKNKQNKYDWYIKYVADNIE